MIRIALQSKCNWIEEFVGAVDKVRTVVKGAEFLGIFQCHAETVITTINNISIRIGRNVRGRGSCDAGCRWLRPTGRHAKGSKRGGGETQKGSSFHDVTPHCRSKV